MTFCSSSCLQCVGGTAPRRVSGRRCGGNAMLAADACRQLATGLRYYFGVARLPVHLVAGLVYGLDFDAIKSTLGIPEVQQACPPPPPNHI